MRCGGLNQPGDDRTVRSQRCEPKFKQRRFTMLIRTTMALALIVASASGSLAAQKKHSTDPAYRAFASESLASASQKKHSTNPAYDVYDVRGRYVGSDPDATVRAQIARDPVAD